MPRLYIFAIGGTGARVLRAFTLLLAAGVEPKDSNGTPYEIVPLIIDPDGANGNVAQTINLLETYSLIRSRLGSSLSEECFFNGTIKDLPNLAGISNPQGLQGYKLIIPNVDSKTFGQFIGYNQLPSSSIGGDGTKELLELLYTQTNLNTNLNIGFQGFPNMGSVVLNQFTAMPAFQTFANAFNQGDRIFIISSIFGGTGAAGFPLLVKNLRNPNANLPNFNYINQAILGAVVVQPYFSLPNKTDSPIDSKQFITKTKAALSYYESNLRGLNSLYYIGDEPQSVFQNNPGGASQKNQAHFIEFASALSVFDFLKNAPTTLDLDYREFGANTHSALNLSNLSKTTQLIVKKSMIRFWLFNQYVNHELSNSSAFNQRFFTTQPIISNAIFENDFFFKNLKKLVIDYDDWLDGMASSQISFDSFDKKTSYMKVFESIHGFKPNRNFLERFVNDDNTIVKEINNQSDNHKGRAVPEKFIEGIFEAFHAIESRIF